MKVLCILERIKQMLSIALCNIIIKTNDNKLIFYMKANPDPFCLCISRD